jgi:hypothetical protein
MISPNRKDETNRSRVGLEVVSQLAPRKHHCVEQLLYLGIPRLGLGQHFTDIVHWPLDW